jgi:acyl-coenzyme A thioesterase 1/2/4
LFGIGGGKLEYRAALLAARGYAVLALAHSNYKDLPKKIDDVDINYFKVKHLIIKYAKFQLLFIY